MYGITMCPIVPRSQLREVYLIKWRADYVAKNTDEAVTSRAIENVKWANEQHYENLKMAANSQQKG